MANNLIAELVLDIKKFRRGLQNAQNSAGKAFKGGKAGASFADSFTAGISNAGAAISKTLAGVVTVGAVVAGYQAGKIIAGAIKGAAENERFQMRFEVLTGNRGAGNRVLQDIRNDAMRTGVAVSDMADNVGKFIAFGFDPEEALQLNKGILDVGGAVGLTTRDMKLLGVALSQVAAKGVANMEELRQQIAEKGIPIFKALEQRLGVTGAKLNKMVQEGEVSAEDVLELFTDIGKGKGPFAKFAGGADKMATTVEGMVNRIKMVWAEFLRMMGDPIIDALKPFLDMAFKRFDAMRSYAEQIGNHVAGWVTGARAFVTVLQGMEFSEIGALLMVSLETAIKTAANFLVKALSGAFAFVLRFMIEGIKHMFTGYEMTGGLMKAMLGIAAKFGEAIMLGIAEMIEQVKKASPAMRLLFKESDTAIREAVKKSSPENDQMIKDGWNEMQPGLERLIAGQKDRIKSSMDEFMENFNETPDMFNVTGGNTALDQFIEQLRKTFEEMRKEREAATKARNTQIGEAPGPDFSDANRGKGQASGSGFALNSRLSQAINTISGRSAYQMLAAEASKSNALLGKIEQNTRPKPSAPTVANVTVNGGGTFV